MKLNKQWNPQNIQGRDFEQITAIRMNWVLEPCVRMPILFKHLGWGANSFLSKVNSSIRHWAFPYPILEYEPKPSHTSLLKDAIPTKQAKKVAPLEVRLESRFRLNKQTTEMVEVVANACLKAPRTRDRIEWFWCPLLEEWLNAITLLEEGLRKWSSKRRVRSLFIKKCESILLTHFIVAASQGVISLLKMLPFHINMDFYCLVETIYWECLKSERGEDVTTITQKNESIQNLPFA